MAGSNLTNTFIANTYQKLLQVDNINGSVGTTATFDIADAISSSKYNLLNGLGQTMPGFVIDTTGNGNGGLMFKDSNYDPGGGLWSIQTFETSNNEAGLNFWRPSGVTNAANAKLFLKNTGSVWVGYQDSVNPTPVIPTDVSGYSLYVKDGIKSFERAKTKRHHGITSTSFEGFTDTATSPFFVSLRPSSYPDWNQAGNSGPFSIGSSSLGRTPVLGVTRDDNVILSGYYESPGAGNNGLYFRIINARQIAPWINHGNPNGNFIDIYSGGGGGNNQYLSVQMHWQRIGAIVNVAFKVNLASTGASQDGSKRYVYIPLPVVPINAYGGYLQHPTNYNIWGSGVILQDGNGWFEGAEVKTEFAQAPFFRLSWGNKPDNRDIRGHFSYTLFDGFDTPTQNIPITDPFFSIYPGY